MRACPMIIAALLVAAGPARAEPPKSPPPAAGAAQHAPVVLASADAVRTATPDSGQAAPAPATVKRVKPRITTCRCGDPLPQEPTENR